jgi:predicted alpha/beta-fold hydrolase
MHGEFRPLPLLGNAHVQTILGNLLSGPAVTYPTEERRVQLTDGDQLVLHDTVPGKWRPGEGIALLIHGLSGSHASGYMKRMARRLLPSGWRVVRMDLRGCGRGMALARRPYHGGCSQDVREAALEIGRWSPTSPLALIGFSLGGNISLKLAGEAAEHPLPNLKRVAAVSPPIDLTRCAELLALPRNRFYERHYVRGLVRQVRQRRLANPDEPAVDFPRRMTMRLFDDLYTAPRWQFADALHYYRSASALPYLARIGVPTLILTARDDPFIAVEPFEQFLPPPHIEVAIMSRGGHLGFLGWSGTGGIRWAEHRVAEWVKGAVERHLRSSPASA